MRLINSYFIVISGQVKYTKKFFRPQTNRGVQRKNIFILQNTPIKIGVYQKKHIILCPTTNKRDTIMSKMRFFALQELSNRKPLEITTPSNKLSDYYASHVFDRKKMQEYLPKEAYKVSSRRYRKRHPYQPRNGRPDSQRHEKLAKSLNVTHYTHWFQPLT